jgi:hypothetical protein
VFIFHGLPQFVQTNSGVAGDGGLKLVTTASFHIQLHYSHSLVRLTPYNLSKVVQKRS